MQLDVEKVIALLEAQGDFKVLRRMPEVPAGKLELRDGVAKVIIIDTETTGLSPQEDKLIEVGAIARYVDVETGTFVGGADIRSWLEDPGFPLEPHTVALTGLTDVDLQGQRFNDADIGEFMRGAALVIAHSASHDRPFFEQRFPALKNFPWGCSLTQINWKEAGAGSSKLEYLAFLQGRFYQAHRALPDCHALAYVLEHSKLPSGMTALQHLLDQSERQSVRIDANGAPFEMKDVLKAAGYHWDAGNRVWHTTVDDENLDDELDWLRSNVYGGRSARVRLDFMSAHARFSSHPPEGSVMSDVRSIGARSESLAFGGGANRYSPPGTLR